LAVANNITQASHVRLDHVALTLGNLYRIYSDPAINEDARKGILNSLDKRWRPADQEVFILAVFFNPYIRHHVFSKHTLSQADICDIAERVYKRFFGDDSPLDFFFAFMEYYEGKGHYSRESMRLDELKAKFDNEVSNIPNLNNIKH
jgi:hypothetical protein